MARSTAIAWKIRLTVFGMALPFSAMVMAADETVRPEPAAKGGATANGGVQSGSAAQRPAEPSTVRIILQPPADDSVFALRRAEPKGIAPVVVVRPAAKDGVALPRPEPLSTPQEAIAPQPSPPPVAATSPVRQAPPARTVKSTAKSDRAPFRVKPVTANKPVRLEQQPEAKPASPRVVSAPEPAREAAPAAPWSSETATIQQEEAAPSVAPASPAAQPRVAAVSPAERATRPRPKPASIQIETQVIDLPSVPERAPLRQSAYYREATGEEVRAAAEAAQQKEAESKSVYGKMKSAFKSIGKLLPGGKDDDEEEVVAEVQEQPAEKPKSAFSLEALKFWKKKEEAE